LERVKRLAKGQGLTLEFDDSLVDHFADVGYQPEYGARELRRQIRAQLETELAGAMLRGDIGEGDTVKFLYDRAAGKVRWEKQAERAAAGEEERAPRGRGREAPRPAAH
jgi:ATP-dependent Clp protease ATP-binding subunit ClpC